MSSDDAKEDLLRFLDVPVGSRWRGRTDRSQLYADVIIVDAGYVDYVIVSSGLTCMLPITLFMRYYRQDRP